ncbi:metallophosphoesterase [Psychromonas sp. MME1]
MTTIIHISDLHIHGSNKHPDNINAKTLVSYIMKNYASQPITILITGDITDDGSEEQYENALNILKPLVEAKFTVLPTPGNHDYGYKGNIYTEKSQQLFQEYMLAKLINHKEAENPSIKMENIYPMITEIDDTIFIGVDSVVGNENQLLHFASGEVGEPQRIAIDKLLKKYQGNKSIVVYFHHHPFD